MRTLTLLALILSLAPDADAAHCACGGDTFPGAALNAETVGIGSVAVSSGFGYNQYEIVSRGEFEGRARTSPGKRHEGPSSVAAASLGVTWGLGESYQLGISQSWQRMSDYREGFVNGAGVFEYYDHGTLSGLKDLGLSFKGRLLEASWGHLALQGDLSVPSGAQIHSPHNQADPAGNSTVSQARPLPGWVQPGRGAWDSSLSGIYSQVRGSYLFDLSYSYSFPVSAGDYTVGQRQALGLALGLKYFEHHTAHLDLISVQGKQDSYRGVPVLATGGAFEGIGLRSSHPLNPRTQLSAQLMFPLLFGTAGQEGTRVSVQGAVRITTLF